MKAPPTRKSLPRRAAHACYRGLRGIVVIQDSPHRIAWGVAIGTFVAYLPLVGIQMVIGAIVCKFLRANVYASIPMAWITNPLTIVPIFYVLFLIGGWFLGESMTYDEMKEMVDKINEAGIWTWAGIKETISLIGLMFGPMLLGGIIVGLTNGALFYVITLKLVATYQLRRSKRREEWRKSTEQNDAESVQPEEESQESPESTETDNT